MAAPKVFLDDIADKPPVIDDGKLVLLEVKEASVKYGKESGDPYIGIQVQVVDDPEDEGSTMFDNLMLPLEQKEKESDKAYKKRMDRRCFRLKRAVSAFIGGSVNIIKGLDLVEKANQEALAEAFLSRRAWTRATIGQDNRNNPRSETSDYYAEGSKPTE